MKYVFYYLFAYAVTWLGCMIAILSMRCRIRNCKQELKFLRESLTKPESYIWVDKTERLPEHDGEYLVECRFGEHGSMIFHRVNEFSTSRNRFSVEGWCDIMVLRWAELPK